MIIGDASGSLKRKKAREGERYNAEIKDP